MKYQALFSLKNNEKMLSAAVVIGALRVKFSFFVLLITFTETAMVRLRY